MLYLIEYFMILFKYLIITLFLFTSAHSSSIDFTLNTKKIENANVVLITAKSKEHYDLKAILDDKEISFNKHPFKNNHFYALIPFHYFMEEKTYQIIVTYTINRKEYYEGFDIALEEGLFDKEHIRVSGSKVSLNTKNKKRVSKEYEHAMDIYSSVTAKNYWYEDFIYPIDSHITSNFGTKRVYNNITKSYHTGIDFKAQLNTNIYSSNNGVVKIASNRFYAGNSVIVDHGQGIYTCYFHLNKIFVSEGDFVQRGDILGLSGNTGRSTGPHLHFATFVNGIQINPLKLLAMLNDLND